MKPIFYLILVLFFFNAPLSFAQVDPNIDWKVMKTPYATWVFDSRHRSLVRVYQANFAKVLPRLKAVFKELPEETTFVISDSTDLANGSATVFPYPMITIFPVMPLPTSGIGDSSDFLFDIVAHEYTHILNLYPAHGFMKGLSYIFGSIVRPNALLPRWYTEGLAVYMETQLNNSGGRLRSQNIESLARALSLGRRWEDFPLENLNEGPPDWVGGRRPYLLGGAIMNELVNQHQLDSVYRLNDAISRRPPYSLKNASKAANVRQFKDTLNLAFTRLHQGAQKQIEIIQSAPSYLGKPLKDPGRSARHPRLSPAGTHLAYISSEHNVPSGVYLSSKNNHQFSPAKLISNGIGISQLQWHPTTAHLYFNKVAPLNRYYQRSDLYSYDLKEDSETQVSHGLRVAEFIFSQIDPNTIYVLQHVPGGKRFGRYNLKKNTITPIYTAPHGHALFALTGHQKNILFIERNGTQNTLRRYSEANDEISPLGDATDIVNLHWQSTGQLIITSRKSGVDNLYWIKNYEALPDQHLQAKALTNTPTRIGSGTLDPATQNLYYTELTPSGTQLFWADQATWQNITEPPKVTPLLERTPHPTFASSVQNPSLAPPPTAETEDYSSLSKLRPRYWMPFGFILDGGFGVSAATSASDPLGKNLYSLTAQWDTLTEKIGFTGLYANNSTPVTMSLQGYNLFRFNQSNDSSVEDAGGQFSAQTFIPYLSNNWRWGLNWRYSDTKFSATSEVVRSGPGVYINYNNAQRRGYDISPESGGSFSLYHQNFLEDTGDAAYEKTNFNGKLYLSGILPKRHVFFTQINATYAPDLESNLLAPNVPSSLFFTETIGGNIVSNSLVPPFLMRGYDSGSLLGYNVVSLNMEYRFPISQLFKGFRTAPVFLRQLSGSLVADGITLDGFRRNAGTTSFRSTDFGDSYWGAGTELHLDTKIGYFLPIRFTFGVYYGFEEDISGNDVKTFFSFTM